MVSARLSPLAAELTAGSALVILAPPKPQHGAFERQARAGGRLVEQARQDGFGRQIGAAPDPVMDFGVGQLLQKPVRDLEDRLDLRIGEVIDRNEMARQRLGFAHQSGAIGPIRAVRQASIRPAAPVCTGIDPRWADFSPCTLRGVRQAVERALQDVAWRRAGRSPPCAWRGWRRPRSARVRPPRSTAVRPTARSAAQ